jgi:hypothetical protein
MFSNIFKKSATFCKMLKKIVDRTNIFLKMLIKKILVPKIVDKKKCRQHS